MVVSILSCDGKVQFGLVSDAGLVPDPEPIIACFAGGMAGQRAVAEKWKQVTGVPLIEGYGLTETSPVVTSNALDIREWTGTIGLPIPSTDVALLDEEGREVPLGEIGESASADRRSAEATGTARKNPPRRSPRTAGFVPATWAP